MFSFSWLKAAKRKSGDDNGRNAKKVRSKDRGLLLLERLEDRISPDVNSNLTGGLLTLTYTGVANDSVTVQATTTAATFNVTPNGGTKLDSGTSTETFAGVTAVTVAGTSTTG